MANTGTTSSTNWRPIDGEVVIDKPGKGAFYATELQDVLTDAGITQLLVTGVTTEVCVHTTTREANDRGYECLVVSDCVGSYFPEFQRIGLEMINAQGGIFGWVADTTAVIPALQTLTATRRLKGPAMSTDVTNPPADPLGRSADPAVDPVVDPRRHQRVLRSRVQHPGQRPDPDRL